MSNKIIYRARRRKLAVAAATLVIAIAFLVLLGWAIDLRFLTQVYPGMPPMKVNTAIALLLAGLSFYFIPGAPAGGLRQTVPFVCGGLVIIIGSLTLIEYIADINVGLDNLFFASTGTGSDSPFPGRMSPHTAFNLSLIGSSILLLHRGRPYTLHSELLAILSLITTFAAVLGHLYGAHSLYGVSAFNSMALHTAFSCGVVSVGLLSANIDSKMVKLLLSDSVGGTTARRLLPVAVLIPAITGWLRMIGQQRGYYDTGSGAALTAIVSAALLCTSIYYLSLMVRGADLRRQAAERLVAENERKYRQLVDHGQGLICTHDVDGRLTMINPAALVSLGYTEKELLGLNLRELLPPDHRAEFDVYLRRINNDGIAAGMFPIVSKGGNTLAFRYRNILVSEEEAKPYVLGHAQEVTKLLEAQNALKNLSLTDELTGLYNRRGFLTLAAQQVKLELHPGTALGLTLLFIDMDGLKYINDTFGHESGSAAINQVADILRSSMRSADIVARWGGDEFVILSIGAGPENIELIQQRLNRTLLEHNSRTDQPFKLGFSIGFAELGSDGAKSIEEAIATADAAMYTEKKRRKADRASLENVIAV